MRTHQHLREHFRERAGNGEEGARLEAAYHALALGDAEPAIGLGVEAQLSRLALRQPLVEAVTQAPTDKLPDTTEARAFEALTRAEQQHEMQSVVKAIVLYTWLISASQDDQEYTALLQHSLGLAYSDLPSEDRASNLERAIACYQAALQVRTREAFPVEWANTQTNLGTAYADLPTGDRAASLAQAIACYQAPRKFSLQTRSAVTLRRLKRHCNS